VSETIRQRDKPRKAEDPCPFPSGLPDPESSQILRLIFGPAQASEGSWHEVFTRLEEEPPGESVYQVLPLLAAKWKQQHADSPVPTKLTGIRRKNWYRHQQAERAFSIILQDFLQAGVRTLVLGDLAAALSYYDEAFDRPVQAYSFLVDFGQVPAAISLLKANGWETVAEPRGVDWEYFPGLWFEKDGEHHALYLRWHVLPQCCFPGADSSFWSRALPLAAGETLSMVLDPTSELLYLISELCLVEPGRSVAHLADTMMLLQKHGEEIDWQHLLDSCRRAHLVLPLKTLFAYLARHFDIHMPAEFQRNLAETHAGSVERMEARYPRAQADRRLPGLLPVLWFDYRRQRDFADTTGDPPGFGDYLARYWQLDSRLALYGRIWQLAWRRLKPSPFQITRPRRAEDRR